MKKDQDRQAILDMVTAYGEAKYQPTDFVPGESVVPVSGKVLDPDDLVALVDACSTAG